MKNTYFKRSILSMSVLTLPLLALGQVPTIQTEGSIKFIAGGIGSEESSSMKAEAKNWPLLIELSQKDGMKSDWITEVNIIITDTKGNPILNQSNQGPMLLVGLKPGKYMIECTYLNVKMARTVVITSAMPQKISFQWQ